MSKVSVPLYGNMIKKVVLESRATEGAVVGVNLFDADGNVIALKDILNSSITTSGIDLSNFTTDDLDEGAYNLYFTNERARDAVGAILADSANVTLRYVDDGDAPGSIVADLTDLTDTGTGTLQALTFDAKGRKTGSRPATITGTADRVTVDHGDASDGLPTIDLATVADTGGGTLLRFVRDAWGRVTGTSAATTDDLDEGSSNLYFTDTRVYAKAKSVLQAGTNVTITPDDGAETLTIVATGGGGGIPDAPSDGMTYGRQDAAWVVVTGGGGSGDVVGPASATDGAVAIYDGTTGKLLKDGPVLGSAATADATDFDAAGSASSAQAAAQSYTDTQLADYTPTSGLGSAAFTNSTDYATASQGAEADSAVQPGDLATVATTGAYSDLSGLPTLGTAAATDATDYATSAQGATADNAIQPGDNISTLTNDSAFVDAAGAAAAAPIQSLVEGTNITIDVTDPENPVINASGGGGSGDVVGPASATDGAVALFDGATGKLLKNGVVLGTAATTAATDYATAAQGTLADSATQPGDNVSDLTNDAGYIPDAPSDGKDYVRKNAAWSALTVKEQTGSATAPASHADQTSVTVTFPTAFATAPKVFVTVTSGPVVGSGGLVSYLQSVPTTTGFTVYFDVAEGSGSPSTIDNPVNFDWLAKLPGVSGSSGGGAVLQIVTVESNAIASTTSTGIPLDNTIPQITEGDQLSDYTISITPKRSDTTIEVKVNFSWMAASPTGSGVRFAAFRDSSANAVFATSLTPGSNSPQVLTFHVPSNAVSATTFTFRWAVSSGTAYLHRTSSTSSAFGGTLTSSVTVSEIT